MWIFHHVEHCLNPSHFIRDLWWTKLSQYICIYLRFTFCCLFHCSHYSLNIINPDEASVLLFAVYWHLGCDDMWSGSQKSMLLWRWRPAGSFWMVTMYPTTQLHIPEYSNLHGLCRENLRSHIHGAVSRLLLLTHLVSFYSPISI
jgi:hypothetical protein